MSDLISRAALLKECEKRQKSNPLEDGRGRADNFLNDAQCPSAEWNSVEEMIEYAPAVDAVLVVHGRWIDIPDKPEWDQKACSICGDYFCCHLNYCPNCGAKMDGGKEE